MSRGVVLAGVRTHAWRYVDVVVRQGRAPLFEWSAS